MSALVNENTRKIVQYIAYFFLTLIGLYLLTIILKFIFNLGTYFGTFIRCLYALVCN